MLSFEKLWVLSEGDFSVILLGGNLRSRLEVPERYWSGFMPSTNSAQIPRVYYQGHPSHDMIEISGSGRLKACPMTCMSINEVSERNINKFCAKTVSYISFYHLMKIQGLDTEKILESDPEPQQCCERHKYLSAEKGSKYSVILVWSSRNNSARPPTVSSHLHCRVKPPIGRDQVPYRYY